MRVGGSSSDGSGDGSGGGAPAPGNGTAVGSSGAGRLPATGTAYAPTLLMLGAVLIAAGRYLSRVGNTRARGDR